MKRLIFKIKKSLLVLVSLTISLFVFSACSINIDTKIDTKGFNTGIKDIASIAKNGLSLATKAVSATVTGLVTLGGAAIQTGIEFESAFAGVKKTLDATPTQLDDIRTAILDLSGTIPLAATEIASIAEAAGQLGIETPNVMAFTEVMANLGVATNMTSDQAATALARLANITGMAQTDFDRLGSTIVALGNNLATTESEIVEMSLRLAGTGSQAGMSEAEILSLSGALSSVGLAAEAGGSAFSRVISIMQLAAENGGEALNQLADIAGMTGAEFKTVFKNDAPSALMAFISGLGEAEKSGKSAIGVLSELAQCSELQTLNTITVRDALLRAAGASDVFSDALEIGTAAWEDNNALVNEATQRYETLDVVIKEAKASCILLLIVNILCN